MKCRSMLPMEICFIVIMIDYEAGLINKYRIYQPRETFGVASTNGEMVAEGETEDAIAPHLLLLFVDADSCSGLVARRSKLCGRLRAAQAILRNPYKNNISNLISKPCAQLRVISGRY